MGAKNNVCFLIGLLAQHVGEHTRVRHVRMRLECRHTERRAIKYIVSVKCRVDTPR